MLDPQTEPIKKLGIACPENCSLSPIKIGWKNANALAATRARGAGQIVFQRRAQELLGHPVPSTNIQRHFKHYVEPEEPHHEENPGPKKPDVAILDEIIAAGSRNSKNWKPTIRDTLEAMKLKMQMTGNSAFDDLIALFDVDDDDEEAPEAAEALLSEAERPNEDSEDLEEPLAGE